MIVLNVETLVVIQPYTDLGFDPLARIIAAEGLWNLELSVV